MFIFGLLARVVIGLACLIYLLIGTIVIVHSIWTFKGIGHFQLSLTGVLLLSGLLYSAKGSIGLFGICWKQKFLLKMLLFIMVMIISLEFGVFVSLKMANVEVSDFAEQIWNEANANTRHYLQEKFHCCGLTGLSEFGSKLDPIDSSCYAKVSSNPYRVGCKLKIATWIKQRRRTMLKYAFSFVFFQVLIVLVTLIYLRNLHNRRVNNTKCASSTLQTNESTLQLSSF